MECEDKNGNPWASFYVEARLPKKLSSKIIDNRFPNNFKKSSSIVTCNICQVLLLKSQTLYHFKALHNKKLGTKCSKYIIPYNAIEVYDLMCEHKTKNLLLSKKPNGSNKNGELFQLKRSKFEVRNSKNTTKSLVKLEKSTTTLTKSPQFKGTSRKEEIKIEASSEKILAYNNDETHPTKIIPDNKILENHHQKLDTIKLENRSINKCLDSNTDLNNRVKINDLKLNIKVNSNGTLTSSMKVAESNIFDRMSNLCDNSLNNITNVHSTVSSKRTVKQVGFDQSYGCTVFTDEHNNSILIDNDKDDLEDFDCCESSMSNDSAYYSLPNSTTANSLSTPFFRKSSNFYDSSVAPPLVTAYQFSSCANTISYNSSGSDSQKRFKPSATMVVTRNLSKNMAASTKSNVKHRFYVSSHSNQNILNSIRKTSNSSKSNSEDSAEHSLESYQSGILHNIPTENRDFLNFGNNAISGINKQLNIMGSPALDDRDISNTSLNTRSSREFIRQSLLNNSYWDCIEEKGIKNNLLIPKRLSWNYITPRCKTVPHLYKKQKYSPDIIVPQSPFNSVISHSSISENPLLASNSVESTGIDSYLEASDLINTPGILLDYPFPDRNQMSFQQRLLERGVISQRDIARSQRCLSLNNQTLIRKNVKSNSNKQVLMDCKRMLTNKTNSFKNQIIPQNGTEIVGPQYVVNKSNYTYMDPAIKDTQKSRSTILLDKNFDLMSSSILCNQRNSWHDSVKLPRIPSVNSNITTFQGLCLSQTNKPSKPNTTIVIGPDSNFNTILSQLDTTSDTIIPNYKYQSDSSLIQLSKGTLNSGFTAQNMLPSDTICFSQPLARKYINHTMNNSVNRYNGCTQNFVNHSTNVIHTNFDR